MDKEKGHCILRGCESNQKRGYTMASEQLEASALLPLIQGIFSEGGGEQLKELLSQVLQVLLEAERTEHLGGVKRYERSELRRDMRNGYKRRGMKSRLGNLILEVPQTRLGYRSRMFERYERSERAMLTALAEMYIKGISTRKVTSLVEEVFGTTFSVDTVSRATKQLDEEVRIWREQRFEEKYPYLLIDARYEKVRVNNKVINQGVLIIHGISEHGRRRVLDFDIANTESEASWTDIFRRLLDRGLEGVEFVVSDSHEGLRRAVQVCFQGASWQRCQVHFMRNISQRVPVKIRASLLNRMSEAYVSGSAHEARLQLEEIASWLREIGQDRAAINLEEGVEDTLVIYSFPPSHQRRLRTTNLPERYMREIKRRSRVIGIFPNRESLERLLGVMLMEQDEAWLCERPYIIMEKSDNYRLQEIRKIQGKAAA